MKKIEGIRLMISPEDGTVFIKGTSFSMNDFHALIDSGKSMFEIVEENKEISLDDVVHSAILDYAIGGLLSDKKEYKQWYLEEIVRMLGFNLQDIFDILKKDGYKLPKRGQAPPGV